VDAAIVPERLIATLAGFFGTVGALLAALGLYGLLAYTVSRRKSEIGLRMALGAARLDVLSLVLRQALGLVFMGFLIGVPVAIWSKHLAGSVLQNVSAGGTGPIVAAAFTTIVIAGLAVYLPARRATRVDPVRALRSE
jgi:putative ABC transport system permease protein